MFSKKTLIVVAVAILIVVNVLVLSISGNRRFSFTGPGGVIISVFGPFQEIASRSIWLIKDIWRQYFYLVSLAQSYEIMENALGEALERNTRYTEVERANTRLRDLLDFQRQRPNQYLPAEIIGKDPSPWFKSVVIDKGSAEGVRKGLPVVISKGIVGMVTETWFHYAKVLLIIDQNSAVDAIIQQSRARGIVKGKSADRCRLDYVLRKHRIEVGDTVISSGLDGVFPKGLRIGEVSNVIPADSGVFQEVIITPFVDFNRMEEVLVVISPPAADGEETAASGLPADPEKP